MNDYKSRMKQEYLELTTRISKLRRMIVWIVRRTIRGYGKMCSGAKNKGSAFWQSLVFIMLHKNF